MLLTIAVVAVATGTIAKFQIGMCYIGLSADVASVGVGCQRGCGGCLVRTGVREGDHFCLFGLGGLTEQTPCVCPPGRRNHVNNIFAEEQEIVQQGNEREQVIGEGASEQGDKHQNEIQQSEDPCLHRNDEKQQETGIGIQGGLGQEQAHVQIGDIGLTSKDQCVYVCKNDAGQIEEVEFEGAPNVLHGTA